jgi:putative peptidoglycan lipid II flippase
LAAFAVGLPAFVLVKAFAPGFFAREDTRTPLVIAVVAIVMNVALNLVFLYGTALAQVGIALATSLSGWLNAVLLAVVLHRRDHWIADRRLVSRSLRMLAATAGMGVVLSGALVVLAPIMAQATVKGALAFVGICVLGAAAYAALGALLGVVRLSELRFVMRRQPGLRSADPDGQP